MDSQGNCFFIALLQEEDLAFSQYGLESQQQPQSSIQTQPMTKKARGGNFSIDEDNLLVSAWLNTSLDAIHGNEQKQKTFWKRVWENFHKNKTFIGERSEISLMNRWSTIQQCTNKFCGYVVQIEPLHQSSTTDEDMISKAKQMYREHNKGAPFPFEHCWNVLKHQPKWSAECDKKKPKRVRSHVQSTPSTPSTTSTPDMINIEVDMTCDTVDPMERPIGRKAEKEKRRKLNVNASVPVVDLLVVAMQDERKKTSDKKLEILQSSVAIQVEMARIEAEKTRIEAKKTQLIALKEEERIMTFDTSTLTPMLQEYYHHRQLEILESRRNKQSSSSSRMDSDASEFES